MITRKEWGARGSVPLDGTRKFRIAVHHTVSPNERRNRAQERAYMRATEAYHMSLGWNTIGYSYVVFPSGRVYVGRGRHGLPAAQEGANSGSWAIAFAGTYTTAKPTLRARRSARKLIQALKQAGGRQLGGHQEFPGQGTACPGGKLLSYVRKWRAEFGLRHP